MKFLPCQCYNNNFCLKTDQPTNHPNDQPTKGDEDAPVGKAKPELKMHLKPATFIFHRIVLTKNGEEFCQQYNSDFIYSLAMIYCVVGHCEIILVIKFAHLTFIQTRYI